MATPTVIKNGVNFFHIGYYRGTLLMVLVSEMVRYSFVYLFISNVYQTSQSRHS
jgi:hypothetical protein